MLMKNLFRWIHAVWAIIGASSCILLAAAKGGHPPGLVFVPVAAAIWLAGHLLLWASHKLAIRGKKLAESKNISSGRWPVTIILLTIVCGAIFIFGLFGIAWQVLSERNWLHELAIPLLYWIPASLCFFGILLRQDWSRVLAGSGFMVVAAILLYEMVASAMRGYRNSTIEWLIVIALFISLVLLGLYVLRSPKIKAFYAGDSHVS
jgi:hypothetical protein